MSIPMYKKIQQDLFNMIASGQLREGDRIPSESELVEQYYVSAITAKNALNSLADRGLITRVRGKGSFVSKSPYSISRTDTNDRPISIGAIFPSVSSLIDQTYMMYLNELCQKNNYRLYSCCSQENVRTEKELLNQYIKSGVQGTILFPVVTEMNSPMITRLIHGSETAPPYPLVFIDRYLENTGGSYIISDNRQGSRLAADYLLNAVGEQIAILHFPLCNSTVTERYDSFRAAFTSSGIPFTPKNDCMIDDLRLLDKSNENRIEYIMASILQHLRKYNQLQGLFCANAEIAQIAYYAVIQMKRTPGVDFEIVSFDPPYLPGVHFIQQDYRTMVQHAIDLLFAQIQGDFTVVQTRIPTSFIYMDAQPTHTQSLRYLIRGPNQTF